VATFGQNVGDQQGAGNSGNVGPGQPPSTDFNFPRYTDLGRFPQPLYVLRGTILAAFQGLQYYEVATDHGRYFAIYRGSSRGQIGAMESAGFLPGEQVWIAVAPSLGSFNGVIIGAASHALAGDFRQAIPLTVFPQVAGLEVQGGDEGSGGSARMSGQLLAELPLLRNYNSGILDSVDSDWMMHNAIGGALAVEAFRTYLQGGPMSGIYCYSDGDHTRVVGSRYELITFAEEYEDRQLGPNIVQVGRKVYYPMDAIYENVPQRLRVSGPAYGGHQEFHSYRDKDNLEDEAPGTFDRIALLHEYRGLDGAYVLTSAHSITLQKRVGVRVPIEILEGEVEEEEEDGEEDGEEEELTLEEQAEQFGIDTDGLTEEEIQQEITEARNLARCEPADPEFSPNKPVDGGSVYATVVQSLRINTDPEDTKDPLEFAMNSRSLADRIVDWQARGGLDGLTAQWRQGQKPTKIFDEDEQPKDSLIGCDPGMWKCVPKSFTLNLDPYTASKRYFLGRAIFTITEDGSVVIQDAQGSQIMMSGGNIYLSAQHDIIQVAGRNKLDVAGRDMGHRAGRHLDQQANEGRITQASGSQMSIVAGMDGHGGILMESRGQHSSTVDTGELPATGGGIIMRSKHFIGMRATNISMKARGPTGWSAREGGSGMITLDAGDLVAWRAKNDQFFGSFGAQIIAKLESAGNSTGKIVLGANSMLGRLHVVNELIYKRLLHQNSGTESFDEKRIFDLLNFLDEYLKSQLEYENHPLEIGEDYEPRFLDSAQYTLPRSQFFTLPQPEWEIRSVNRFEGNSTMLNAFMIDTQLNGSIAFPGTEAWKVTRNEISEPDYGDEPTVGTTFNQVGASGGLRKGI